MKAKELKEITSYLGKKFDKDYALLLELDQKDIDKIMEEIHKKNKNVKSLIDFLCDELTEKDCLKDIQNLEKGEKYKDFSIRNFIIDKILSAKNENLADAIYQFFDFSGLACKTVMKRMQTIEEWITAVNNITEAMEKRGNCVSFNLDFVLKNFDENRIELIESIMIYTTSCSYPLELSMYINYPFLETHILDILKLLKKDYNICDVTDFFYRWHSCIESAGKSDNVSKIDAKFKDVIRYLEQENTMKSQNVLSLFTNIDASEIILSVEMNENNYDIRKMIYDEFSELMYEIEISNDLKIFYSLLLSKLSNLPSVKECQLVIEIFKLDYVKNMSVEARQKILDNIIIPDNYKALKYINHQYKEKNNEYLECKEASYSKPIAGFDYQVQLTTVAEILGKYSIKKVLDGFDDEDEITPRTLIRSLAYKNKQNN